MKSILSSALASLLLLAAFVAALALSLASCALEAPPEWKDTPNPLDTPETFVNPPASMGRFGPHSEFYFTR